MEATLFRVTEITEPGILPAGRYLFTREKRVVLDIELREEIHPRDLRSVVRRVLKAAAA